VVEVNPGTEDFAMTDTTIHAGDEAIVLSGYDAFAQGDMGRLRELFATDAVWTHRNGGRFAGPKHGFDAIAAFFAESGELAAGTLRAQPRTAVGRDGTVAALVHMTGRRPDGRVLDDEQVHVFHLRDGRTAAVDQFVGDPSAVEAFWA
jgi:ketosteroid isomerase-like protein